MSKSLSSRLILWVGLPAAALFLLVVGLSSMRSRNRLLRETERGSRNIARYHAQKIENRLGRAAMIAEAIAREMEIDPETTEESLIDYLGRVVAAQKEIYGSCVAFEPYSFVPEKEFFAPYFYWKGDRTEFVQLGNPEYDYFRWEWYRDAKAAGVPRWSEPYFDDGGGETVMTTYSAPFRRDGQLWGIATIDISLDNLTSEIEEMAVAKTGYAFLISRTGRFVTHPDKTKIMKGSLAETDSALAARMMRGEDGVVHARGPLRGEDAFIAFVPIKAGDLSLAVVYPSREITADALALQVELIILGAVGVLSLVAALFFVVRWISRPISELALATERLAAGQLDLELAPNSGTGELRRLSNAFRKMTGDLKLRMEQLRAATAAKERIAGELNAARTIQESILPKLFPPFPDRSEFSIHALLKPATEVSGDFYDFFFVDPAWLCFVVGDVSGKGVPASLYMAITRTLVKAHAAGTLSPAKILARVNRELCADNETGMFVTLFCGLLHPESGLLVCCNAGHNPPLVVSATGVISHLNSPPGIALGIRKHLVYENSEMSLRQGETILCFTDGVTEAMNGVERTYGEARLTQLLQREGGQPLPELTTSILADVSHFAGGNEQSDDITLLALRFHGTRGLPLSSSA